MKINSKYNKLILDLVSYFKFLPKNHFDILLKMCPELENEKKFKKACTHLGTDYKLIQTSAVFVCDRNARDCYELTKNGVKVVKENGIRKIDESSIKSLRDNSKQSKQLQFKIAESEIFFMASGSLNKKGPYVLSYFNRNMIIDTFKRHDVWNKYKQAKSSRLVGALDVNRDVYAVYDVKNANIELHQNSEKTFMDLVSVVQQKPFKIKYNKILLADSEDIIDKTIKSNWNSILKRREIRSNNNIARNVEHIFDRKISMHDEKLYLFLNRVDQLELVEYLKYDDVDNEIDKFVFELQRDEVLKDKNLRANNPNIGRSFGTLAAYETDDEVVFHMVQQELNKLNVIFTFLCDILEGRRKETRRLVMYGLECNKPLFEKIFEGFDIEYRVINGESLMKEIKRRKGD